MTIKTFEKKESQELIFIFNPQPNNISASFSAQNYRKHFLTFNVRDWPQGNE